MQLLSLTMNKLLKLQDDNNHDNQDDDEDEVYLSGECSLQFAPPPANFVPPILGFGGSHLPETDGHDDDVDDDGGDGENYFKFGYNFIESVNFQCNFNNFNIMMLMMNLIEEEWVPRPGH